MPPKRKGPLQLVQREVDEIQKQVCSRLGAGLCVCRRDEQFEIEANVVLHSEDVVVAVTLTDYFHIK